MGKMLRNDRSCENRRLVSFADAKLWRSAARLQNQAENLGVFSSISIFDEDSIDLSAIPQLNELLRPELPGFGYWVWKPAVILEVLKNSLEGDLIFYVDVGCHLNPGGTMRLNDYFEEIRHAANGIVAFQAVPPKEIPVWDGRWLPTFPDAQWAKGDLLDFFKVRSETNIIETPTIGAGIILIRNVGAAREFLQDWLTMMIQNISLVDDSQSRSDNHPWFIANRHDQAVFSLLAKKRNVPTLSAFEYWYPSANSRRADWQALAANPVHARRDLDFGPRHNVITYLQRLTSGVLRRTLRRNK